MILVLLMQARIIIIELIMLVIMMNACLVFKDFGRHGMGWVRV